MSKILKTTGLNEIEIDVINNALTAYCKEFASTVKKIESNGKTLLFGEKYGDALVYDIRLKLGLEVPNKENTILMLIDRNED